MTIGAQIDEALYYHTDLNEKNVLNAYLELLGQVGIPNPQRTLQTIPTRIIRWDASTCGYRDCFIM